MLSNVFCLSAGRPIVAFAMCFTDKPKRQTKEPEKASGRIFPIGGRNGWYYGNRLWSFRGFIDHLFGGVGIRRGRRNTAEANAGDALDFWYVIFVSRKINSYCFMRK